MGTDNKVDHEQDIYTSLDEAKEEVWRRWHDAALRKKVEFFLGGNLPTVFCNKPITYLPRSIATADLECRRFLELSKLVNMESSIGDYTDDKFCCCNSDKLGLAKMAFYRGINKNGEAIINYRTIVDCAAYDGRRFNEVITLWGEGLISFHHRILSTQEPNISFFDISTWFHSHGMHASEYYRYYLALFLCHGILFENFVTDQSEAKFADSVVLPAVRELEREFGLKPLIVPLAPPDEAADKYWWCYPAHIEEEVLKCMKKSK